MSKFARFIRCCEVCVGRSLGAFPIAFGHAFQESLPPLRGARSCVFSVRHHAFVRRRGGNSDIGRRLRCRPSRFRELLRGAVRFVRLSSAPFRHRVRFVIHSCLRGRSAFRCLAAGKCRSALLRPCCCRFGEIHRMAFVRLRFRGASAAHAFTARTRSLLPVVGKLRRTGGFPCRSFERPGCPRIGCCGSCVPYRCHGPGGSPFFSAARKRGWEIARRRFSRGEVFLRRGWKRGRFLFLIESHAARAGGVLPLGSRAYGRPYRKAFARVEKHG